MPVKEEKAERDDTIHLSEHWQRLPVVHDRENKEPKYKDDCNGNCVEEVLENIVHCNVHAIRHSAHPHHLLQMVLLVVYVRQHENWDLKAERHPNEVWKETMVHTVAFHF
jgi:hypothetical protein